MRLRNYALFVIAAAAVTASPVLAHARLVKSTPAINTSAQNLKELSLTFSERLVPAFSKLQLGMGMRGRTVAVPLRTAVAADGRTLVGTPQRGLMKGAYVINWTAATLDGHKTAGSVPFRIK